MWCEALTPRGKARPLRLALFLVGLFSMLAGTFGVSSVRAELVRTSWREISSDWNNGLLLTGFTRGGRKARANGGRPLTIPVPPSAAVSPNVTLPAFSSYNGANDLVEINAGSEMDRAFSPPGPGSETTIPDSGIRADNMTALQNEVDARANSDLSWTIWVTFGGDYGLLVLRPRPSGSAAGTIYIITTGYASLPTLSHSRLTGTSANRIHPSHAPHCFKLTTTATGQRAITFPGSTANVSRYTIRGAEIAPSNGTFAMSTLCLLNPSSGASNPANYASYVELNQCYIHGVTLGNNGITIALSFEVAYGKVKDCWISHIADPLAETKCLLQISNPGYASWQNTFMEAAQISFLIGGGDPAIPGHVPANIFMDGIHSFRPYEWNEFHPSYNATYVGDNKNGGELKFGSEILIQRLIVENCWQGGQTGDLLTFKTANQLQQGETPHVPSPGDHVYLTNICVRHFLLCNGNGGLDLSGLTQQGSYADPQVSRPQRIDCHSGVIALGRAADYANSFNNHHTQIICGDMNKDIRFARLSGVSPDKTYSCVNFNQQDSDNVTFEDCLLQAGNFSGATLSAYRDLSSQSVPSPAEGRNVLNTMVNGWAVNRVAIFQPQGNFSGPQLATLEPENRVLQSTPYSDVYEAFDPDNPLTSDYRPKHSELITYGKDGTAVGADWLRLSQLLTGVAN